MVSEAMEEMMEQKTQSKNKSHKGELRDNVHEII